MTTVSTNIDEKLRKILKAMETHLSHNKRSNLTFLSRLTQYSLSTASAQIVMVIYTIFVARNLGPEAFGKFAGNYALVGFSIFFVSWGMDTWLLQNPKSLTEPRIWSGLVSRIKARLGIVWGICLFVIAPLIRRNLFEPGLILICVIDVLCDSILVTHLSALNIEKRFNSMSFLIISSRILRLTSALIVVFILKESSPIHFAFARTSATIIGLLFAIYLVKLKFSFQNPAKDLKIMNESFPYAVSELLVLVYLQADVVLVSLLSGSSAAGVYSPASSLVNALFIIPNSIFLIILPILSRQFISLPEKLYHSIRGINLGFLGLGIILAISTFLLGGWVIRLILTDQYIVSSALVKILSPLLFFKSLCFGWAAFIVAVGWQRQRLIPQAISAGVNVVANLIIIPRIGVPGVATAYIASEAVLALGYAGLVIMWFIQNNKTREKPK